MDELARLRRALWIFAVAFVAHEMEEWNIASWSERNFENFTGVSNEGMWAGLVLITSLGVTAIVLATRLKSARAMGWVILPFILIVVANVLQHLLWTFLFAEYAPGVVSATLFMAPATGLLIWRLVEANAVPTLGIASVLALDLYIAIVTWRAGNVLLPPNVALQNGFERLARALGLVG